ncbi:MAG: hypothetical protein ACW98F_09625 [Candidatus Hodarchaeales archaeon]|jgi:hypothetical protein
MEAAVTYRRETWNRFLHTILERLPPLIAKYSDSNQKPISDVFDILSQGNVHTQKERIKFLAKMDEFVRNTMENEKYYQTPFLWFSNTFFLNSQRLLVEASFHADDFIQYLVRVLRGNPSTPGFFQLIKDKTPLSDLKWETLQYYCNEIHDPLTEIQMDILRVIYSMVNSDPLRAMDQHYLTREIAQQIQVTKQFRGLHHLFSRLDARWGVWMFSEAFGISMLMFKLTMTKQRKLEPFLDFHSPESFVFQMSNVYCISDFPDSFFGFIYIPSECITHFYTYLEQGVENNYLSEFLIDPVLTTQAGSSLALYSVDDGWEESYIPLEIKNAIESRRRIQSKDISVKLGYVTPQLSNRLNYQILESPEQAIRVYINTNESFSFGNLPIKLGKDYHNSVFTQADLALLAKFFSKKIAGPTFTVRNILNEFSLDMFWVEIPSKWECTVPLFLHLLPWSSVLTTDKKIILITTLTSYLLDWIKNHLSWHVVQFSSVFRSKTLREEWYDFQNGKWRCPQFLDLNK